MWGRSRTLTCDCTCTCVCCVDGCDGAHAALFVHARLLTPLHDDHISRDKYNGRVAVICGMITIIFSCAAVNVTMAVAVKSARRVISGITIGGGVTAAIDSAAAMSATSAKPGVINLTRHSRTFHVIHEHVANVGARPGTFYHGLGHGWGARLRR